MKFLSSYRDDAAGFVHSVVGKGFYKWIGRVLPATLLALSVFLAACSHGKRDRTAEAGEIVERGKIQYNAGDYTGSLATFHRILNEFDFSVDSIKDSDYITTHFLLGNIHLAYNDYIQANHYYKLAYDKASSVGFREREMRLLVNLAASTMFAGDSVTVSEVRSRIVAIDSCNKVEQTYYVRMLDSLYEYMYGSKKRAVERMKSLMSYVDSAGMNSRWRLTPLSSVSEYYSDFGPSDSAYRYLGLYDALAREYSVSNMMVDCKRRYVRLCARTGDLDGVLSHQEGYDSLMDSLMNPHRFLTLKSGYMNARQEQSDKQIQSLSMTVSMLHIVLIVAGAIIVIAALFIFYGYKFRDMNRQLFRRNKEIVQIEERNSLRMNKRNGDPTTEGDFDSDGLYRRILEFMDSGTEYLDPDFSLNMLAEKIGSNSKYVSQVINDRGCNFRNFINEYRIGEARRRLLDVDRFGNWTIQSIANSVGFLSTSTFNAAFKKFTGMTPSLYQKMSRSDME